MSFRLIVDLGVGHSRISSFVVAAGFSS